MPDPKKVDELTLRQKLDIAMDINPTVTDEKLVSLIVSRFGFAEGLQYAIDRLGGPPPHKPEFPSDG